MHNAENDQDMYIIIKLTRLYELYLQIRQWNLFEIHIKNNVLCDISLIYKFIPIIDVALTYVT